jgi:hypothetical protein
LKIIVGYFYDLVFPIPIWHFWDSEVPPTVWLRSLNGLWTTLLVPPAFVGFLVIFWRKSALFVRRQSLAVLAIAFIVGGAMIEATTMEVRHLSALFPAFFVLAGVPFAIGLPISGLLRSTTRMWLGAVVGVHVLWAALKFL